MVNGHEGRNLLTQ